MIWLPYPSYPASVISLRTEELQETHDDLVTLAKAFNKKGTQITDNADELRRWAEMFFESMDSFYTLGLYVCLELRHRPNPKVTKRHMTTWAKYWEGTRKFRRYINHPDWPENFHTSMRDALLQRDWDWYSAVFKAEDEPFGEVAIEWPTR